MPSYKLTGRMCDSLDIAALWPCAPQIGCIPIPDVDSAAGGERRARRRARETV